MSGATSYRGRGPNNYTRSDERIREDLNERLTDADDIDASGISVEVSNGVATLTGTVDQRWMKHRAEDLAESCGGVRDVNNQIRVNSQKSGSQGGSQSSMSGGSSGSGANSTQGSSGSGQGAGGTQASTASSLNAGAASGSGTSAGSASGSTTSTSGKSPGASGGSTPRN
jgi:hypothetical protein